MPAPLAYTPPYLAEKILTSRSALEGERKQVTVLFADLKGSTELIRDLDSEAAQRLLDPALHHMMDAVHRFEGTVNQVLGDGIMALFGAPVAHEDHAVRACYAALAMQAAMRRYAEEVRRSHGLEMQARVGLNSGEVVVRAIGNDLHMDYSAVGQTTHLAARMEQLATPGSIRLTAATLRLVEGLVQVNTLGQFPVKGLTEPVEVFELIGASAIRRRLQASAARGLTRFVGRQQELAALQQAVEQAGAGHGQVVALVGEAGVGKSRLVYEFVHSHHTPGWLVLESASVSYGKATPYFPVIDLLKRYCHIDDHDDTRTIRAKVTGQVLTLDPALQDIIPALLSLLDALPADSLFLQLDPPQRRQRTLDALKRVLLRESQEQPLLVVCEDLHWMDTETQALLDSLVESLPTARLLLLVNYRPEYHHGWGNKTYYMQLRLDPLLPASAAEVLQALLGDDASLAQLKALLITRTEGNPFFLEESVRALVETGVLVGTPGAYRLAQLVDSVQVPATVQAVLAARIDRLPSEEKRLLQTAAVIGTEVPLPLLQAIAELPEAALHRGLAHLQVAEFLYETRLFPEQEYTFKHALTQQVAYETLLQERRRALHARIVDAIETLYPARVAEHLERLAHHALRGEVWEKAVPYQQQAGLKAQGRSTYGEAVAYLEQTLVALERLPDTREARERAIDLRFDLRSALYPLGQAERIGAYLREAEAIAEALGDRRRLGRALAYRADAARARGALREAMDVGERALAVATALADLLMQVMTSFYLALAAYSLGDYRRGLDLAGDVVARLEGDLAWERLGMVTFPAIAARVILVLGRIERGELAEALASAEEGRQLAEGLDHPLSLAAMSWTVGQTHLARRDLERAVPVLERVTDICQAHAIRYLLPAVLADLGYAYAVGGRVPDALPVLERAAEQLDVGADSFYRARAFATLGEAYLLAGRPETAHDLAGRALALARDHEARGPEAWARRLGAEIAAHATPPAVEQAERHYHQALALADELDMRPLVAHCHRGLGTLYARGGQAEQAHTELSTAIEMFRDMEMTFWLPQTAVALEQLQN